MKFTKVVFRIAGIWGLSVITPLYFMFDLIGRKDPPPITHPGFFYGFVGVALAWQIAVLHRPVAGSESSHAWKATRCLPARQLAACMTRRIASFICRERLFDWPRSGRSETIKASAGAEPSY